MGDMNFRSLDEFWAFYVTQHSKPATRRWHFVATLSSIFFLICSMLFKWWFLLCVPFSGYGLAWYSHFFIEGNIPMFGFMFTGKMDKEMKRLGKRPVLQVF
ncbi:uncharacterized protein LOC112092607 [Morus notabilis]|uniref:uncharacterized protein LOC112092607 n=1 Tax=Morus notabilis TaxID=981085 RepID=UPI000CED209C|nr:uncharacterized protein LOC112092607 [Morus notabilis]